MVVNNSNYLFIITINNNLEIKNNWKKGVDVVYLLCRGNIIYGSSGNELIRKQTHYEHLW